MVSPSKGMLGQPGHAKVEGRLYLRRKKGHQQSNASRVDVEDTGIPGGGTEGGKKMLWRSWLWIIVASTPELWETYDIQRSDISRRQEQTDLSSQVRSGTPVLQSWCHRQMKDEKDVVWALSLHVIVYIAWSDLLEVSILSPDAVFMCFSWRKCVSKCLHH